VSDDQGGGNRMGLSPERLLGARVIDLLMTLSPKSLAQLRRSTGDPRQSDWSQIPRRHLRELAEALEAAYPGVLDRCLNDTTTREDEG
jgi:hypothetical protein